MKKRKNALRAGETLVEVMVSIVIFLLVVAMFQGAISFCTNAQAKSREIRENTQAITESLWSSSETPTPGGEKELEFRAKGGTVTAFEVKVTLDKWDVPYKNTQGTDSTAIFYLYGKPTPASPGGGGGSNPGGETP